MVRLCFPSYHARKILIGGWPASGSSFMYQVAKSLGLKVRKRHGGRPWYSSDFTIFAFRDPRDVLCSHARRKNKPIWDSDGPEAALNKSLDRFIQKRYMEALVKSASMANVLLVRYESFFLGREELFVQLLADRFFIPLSEEKKQEILRNSSLEKNLERARRFKNFEESDPNFCIHGDHISTMGRGGAWRRYFTLSFEERMKRVFGSLLIDLGYEKDGSWSAAAGTEDRDFKTEDPQ